MERLVAKSRGEPWYALVEVWLAEMHYEMHSIWPPSTGLEKIKLTIRISGGNARVVEDWHGEGKGRSRGEEEKLEWSRRKE